MTQIESPQSPLKLDQPGTPISIPTQLDTSAITVVVPCFNESESVAQLKQRLTELQERASAELKDFQWRFLFVDDGSSDSTFTDLQAAFDSWSNARVLKHPINRGLIAALQTGFAACETEWVAVIDSDCTYDPSLLIDLLRKATEDRLDTVTASPYHPQGSVGNVPAWRIWLSRCASQMYRWPMRNKLTCYTSCVRVYRAELVKKCEIVSSGFVGVTELLWRLDYAGAKIGELPATLNPRTTGVSKMRTFRTTVQHFKLLGRIAKQKVLG